MLTEMVPKSRLCWILMRTESEKIKESRIWKFRSDPKWVRKWAVGAKVSFFDFIDPPKKPLRHKKYET